MAPRFTVLLPIVRPPLFLPNAIGRVLAQTVGDLELFVLCDGAPPETIKCAREFAQQDQRVKVREFPKGARHGEAHRHDVLMEASGDFVAYLEDDDLWFSNHLEELEQLLLTVDFGHTIHVNGHPDGSVESLPCDIGNHSFQQRFLTDTFNRFGYSFCGHRLDAYRSLPEGWAPAPFGIWNDLHMWRKFLRADDLNFGTRMVITAVALPSYLREQMSLDDRAREAQAWISRIANTHERAKIIEAAWRSMVGHEIWQEQQVLEAQARNRETTAALAQLDALHPGSLQGLKQIIAVQADAQLELERLAKTHELCQQALSILTADLAAQAALLVDLNGKLVKSTDAVKQVVHSRSWRLTAPLRSAQEAIRRLGRRLRDTSSTAG